MSDELRNELEAALQAGQSLEEIVALLRIYRGRGISQTEAYAVLEKLREEATDEAREDASSRWPTSWRGFVRRT